MQFHRKNPSGTREKVASFGRFLLLAFTRAVDLTRKKMNFPSPRALRHAPQLELCSLPPWPDQDPGQNQGISG